MVCKRGWTVLLSLSYQKILHTRTGYILLITPVDSLQFVSAKQWSLKETPGTETNQTMEHSYRFDSRGIFFSKLDMVQTDETVGRKRGIYSFEFIRQLLLVLQERPTSRSENDRVEADRGMFFPCTLFCEQAHPAIICRTAAWKSIDLTNNSIARSVALIRIEPHDTMDRMIFA